MSKLVTIFGGSGFLGRYVARRLARQGWRVRVAVRRPNEAGFVRPYGTPGQVEPMFCNIRDDGSVRAALAGVDAVVNCVGTFDKGGANNFDAVQHVAAGRIARLAAAAGVARLVHVSALGADAGGDSLYARSKAQGEAAVLEHFPSAIILRPSVMFGPEDDFFNRFASYTRFGPILPLVGGSTRFQPVFVDDVAAAAEKAATGEAAPGVYELGGPEVATLRDLVGGMLSVVNRRRLVLNLPFWLGGLVGGALDAGSAVTVGLVSNGLITRDQVRQLRVHNVVGAQSKGFGDLGIRPVTMASVLPGYLWRYRPSGQYDAIKDSAKRLKKS
jgi:uncharacterized protein YbjT (DUF2867 family)